MFFKADLRSVKRIEVIAVVVGRGVGTVDDPVREVTLYFDDAGTCLSERDPVFPTPWYAPPETCTRARLGKAAPEPLDPATLSDWTIGAFGRPAEAP